MKGFSIAGVPASADVWGVIAKNLDIPDIYSLMLSCKWFSTSRPLRARASELRSCITHMREDPIAIEDIPAGCLTEAVIAAAVRTHPDTAIRLFSCSKPFESIIEAIREIKGAKQLIARGYSEPVGGRDVPDAEIYCRCSADILTRIIPIVCESIYVFTMVDLLIYLCNKSFPRDSILTPAFYTRAHDCGKIMLEEIPQNMLTQEACLKKIRCQDNIAVQYGVKLCHSTIPREFWTEENLYWMITNKVYESLEDIIVTILSNPSLTFKLIPIIRWCVLDSYYANLINSSFATCGFVTKRYCEGLLKLHGRILLKVVPGEFVTVELCKLLVSRGTIRLFDVPRELLWVKPWVKPDI